MARYSLNRRDRKVAGVCSTMGEMFNIDPTILRIGLAAFALIVSVKLALIAYVGAGLWLHFEKKKAARSIGLGQSDSTGWPRSARSARRSIRCAPNSTRPTGE